MIKPSFPSSSRASNAWKITLNTRNSRKLNASLKRQHKNKPHKKLSNPSTLNECCILFLFFSPTDVHPNGSTLFLVCSVFLFNSTYVLPKQNALFCSRSFLFQLNRNTSKRKCTPFVLLFCSNEPDRAVYWRLLLLRHS